MYDEEFVPEYCVWELTLKCNMRCLHCGSSAGRARRNELSLDECFSVADELLALGCRQVTFIGGEVFLYPGWQKVARRLQQGGVLVNIITNAYLLGERQMAEIHEAGLANVGISVDGMAESHNRIRRVPDSFDRVLRAFERLNRAGISIAAVTTLLAVNFPDLPDLRALLAENGVEIWQIQIATAMGSMAGQANLLLPPERVPEVTRFIRDSRNLQQMWIYAGDDIGYYDANEMYLRNRPGTLSAWSGCQAGLRVIGIDSVGNVKGCESLYDDCFIEGNVRRERLTEIWRKEGNFSYNRAFDVGQLTGGCAGCDKAARCRGGCRGACFFSSERLFENPYCCYPGRRAVSAVPAPV